MRKLFLALAFCIPLAGLGGCMTAEQAMTADDTDCQSYGAQPGTDGYLQCREFKSEQRRQSRAQAAAILANGFHRAASAYSRPSYRLRTTCMAIGNMLHCS